ncbi:hypothetical protein L210DRAFT_3511402 [Boletus edulis BED1]|uniref:Uncharacterized protein n=1 Tax=Boletus edulis BED1 TaxID=1328754 RepID=A0AAD4BBC8_BOLED|nr:hypothetical protein L210DRAFT_3511402 [Boletus edulis BED1]
MTTPQGSELVRQSWPPPSTDSAQSHERQSQPPPSTDSAQSRKRQRLGSSLHEPVCSANLVSVPEVDESILDEFESLPPPLSEFYDHFTVDHMDDHDAGTDSGTNSDAKEFLSNMHWHRGDDNEPEPSGIESSGEDHDLNVEDESSDNELLATLRRQLPSTKPPAKRMPAQQMRPTKSKGKGKCTPAAMPASSNDPDHPRTCGNDDPVEPPARGSVANTHKVGPDVYCYRAKNSTDCYALMHNHIAAWALQIMRKTATVDEKPLSLLSLTKRSKSQDGLEVAAGHMMQPVPVAPPMPAPYAYPPPPVIVMPPAAPWGMQHGYPGYLPPATLGSLPPAHTTLRHSTSHPATLSLPTTPSLLTVDLPNENPPETVPFPDIIRWFSFLDQRLRHDPCVNVSMDFSAFGPVLQAKGFLDIAQLSGNYVSVENLQAWLGVEVGTALVIRSYVDLDIQAVNAGKHVLPTDK